MADTILNQRYRLDERIGHGGFGEVFRATDLQLGREVAVKLLASEHNEDRFRAKFRKEAEDVAKLSHPNIVKVFDFGEHEGRLYIVMEFIRGTSLLSHCEALQNNLQRVVRVADQVCDAMQCAHDANIVHRDLTLLNLMIEGESFLRVLDFGLARRLLDTQSNTIVGTPYYIAPEQGAGQEVDGRADIFSFGVCLYRMLAGHFPFQAEHPTAVIYAIRNEDPGRMPNDVPTALQDIVLKCLEKKPEHRFQSFSELRAALAALDRDDLISRGMTVSSSNHEVARRHVPHNPYLNRVMINDPDDFFGRQKEVKRVYSRLDAPRPQSVSIVGERRMGKSSLLNYIYHRRNRRLHMENHRQTLFLYMDFQRIKEMDIERFIDIVFNMVTFELGEEISAARSGRSLDKLDEAIEKLNEKGMRVVILMDEFEAITSNPQFDMSFFSFLRYLANNYKVAYVTSSHSDLQQMCHDKDIADSPFFNIFSTLQLRPFTHDEATQLITVPSEREGIPLQAHAGRILELSGYFPLFIQIACACVYEALSEKPGQGPQWDEVRQAFEEEAFPHYTFVWERMEEVARENLRRVAAGNVVDRRFQHVNDELVRRGYLLERDGALEICSEPFRRFVMGPGAGSAPVERGRGGWRGWLRRM